MSGFEKVKASKSTSKMVFGGSFWIKIAKFNFMGARVFAGVFHFIVKNTLDFYLEII